MVAILSPARNLRPAEGPTTRALFLREAETLAGYVRRYSPWQLESLLDLRPERAFQLYDAYQTFDTARPGWPALLAYNGAAFRNMAPEAFDAGEMAYAQGHLRVLSALYGMLRPTDGVLQHRLGLGRQFTPGGRDLYAFWGDKIYRALFAAGDIVVNLASVDYAKLVIPHMQAGDRMLTCRFLVDKPGGARGTVSTVRAARGLMARYMVEHQLEDAEDLRGFTADGYRYISQRSTAAEYVFIKKPAGREI